MQVTDKKSTESKLKYCYPVKISGLEHGPCYGIPDMDEYKTFAAGHDYLDYLEAVIRKEILFPPSYLVLGAFTIIIILILALFTGLMSAVSCLDLVAAISTGSFTSTLFDFSFATELTLTFLYLIQLIFFAGSTVFLLIMVFLLLRDELSKEEKLNDDLAYFHSFLQKLSKENITDFVIYDKKKNCYKLAGIYSSMDLLKVFSAFKKGSFTEAFSSMIISGWLTASSLLSLFANHFIFPAGLIEGFDKIWNMGWLGLLIELVLVFIGVVVGLTFLVTLVFWAIDGIQFSRLLAEIIQKLENQVLELTVESEQQEEDWKDRILILDHVNSDLRTIKSASRGHLAPLTAIVPLVTAVATIIISMI